MAIREVRGNINNFFEQCNNLDGLLNSGIEPPVKSPSFSTTAGLTSL